MNTKKLNIKELQRINAGASGCNPYYLYGGSSSSSNTKSRVTAVEVARFMLGLWGINI